MTDENKNLNSSENGGLEELLDTSEVYDKDEVSVSAEDTNDAVAGEAEVIEADEAYEIPYEIVDLDAVETTSEDVPAPPPVTVNTAMHKKDKVLSHRKPIFSKKANPVDSDGQDGTKPTPPIRIIAVLTAICAVVALLLATVNLFTVDTIAQNNEKAMLASIREIFDGTVRAKEYALPEDSVLDSVYIVLKTDGICGYAASVTPAGFGGPINLMVGIDSAGEVMGVKIVSMSETPGLGSRVGGPEFLAQFEGLSGEVSVDAISGATISSTAVINGVNTVTTNLLDLEAIANEMNTNLITFVYETVPETEAPVIDIETTQKPVTVAPETDAPPVNPQVTKDDDPADVIVPNPGGDPPKFEGDYTEGPLEYETETNEPLPTEPPPETEPPATEPPVMEPPATEPPATEPPATEDTEPPATEPPLTEDTEPSDATTPPDTEETTTEATESDTETPTEPVPPETDPVEPQETEAVTVAPEPVSPEEPVS